MNYYCAKYSNILDSSARECYINKPEHSDGFSKLPDLYFVAYILFKTAGRATKPMSMAD